MRRMNRWLNGGAALNYPWYDRICRVGEESMLVKMPYEPLPEDNLNLMRESRTITAYVGTAVDVIIPADDWRSAGRKYFL